MHNLDIIDNEFCYNDSDGSIVRPAAEELIGLLRAGNAEALELQIHTKPSKIRFSVELQSGDIKIIAHLNGSPAQKEELIRVGKYGYFLDEGHVYFFLPETRLLARRFLEIRGISSQVKFLASLDASLIEGEVFEGYAELISETENTREFDGTGELTVPLYPYQRRGLQWLLHCYSHGMGTILADDMGLGKTAQIIALISKLISTNTLEHALIVVPNTLVDNWIREFDFFTQAIRPYVHKGNVRSGLSETLQKHRIVIVPYSIMTNDISMLEELQIDLLVFDEASLLKNPDSQRTLSALRLNAFTTIAITGTPVENSLLDIWSISNIVCRDYLGERTQFENAYCNSKLSDVLDQDLQSVEAKISNILLRRMKDEVLEDLPEKIDIHQAVTMSEREKATYEAICDEITSEESANGNVLALIGNLRKFTTHPILFETDEAHSLSKLKAESSKFSRLCDLLTEALRKNEKVLIFANHIRMLDIFVETFNRELACPTFKIDGTVAADDRQAVVDQFSATEGSAILCLNPVTAGMGLNITAANHVVHYSRQWNPALEMQATARAFRNGQTKEVNAYYLYFADTIEEVIDQRLRQKTELSDRVVQTVEQEASEAEFFFNELKSSRRKTYDRT